MSGLSPYKTALDLKRPRPDWIVNEDDADRVQAYDTYWDVFRNVTEAFQAVLRDDEGEEMSRRTIPAARTVIEATNRYLAKDPTITPSAIVINPDGSEVTADEATVAQVMKLWDDFAKREEFFTKFLSMKRWMLIRGDGLFHLLADDTKPEGQRLRIVELDPGSYFTIPDPIDDERLVGVYLVTIVDDDEGEAIAQRQSYLKDPATNKITTKLDFFEPDKWDDRFPLTLEDLAVVPVPARFADSALVTGFELDPRIDTIPVYHYRNNREGGLAFGLSEIQGIETLLAGIIQTATDQDQTIALTGIGIYVTTSGKPRDDDGNIVDWLISPASVMELESAEDRFERVKGVDSVQPLLDHLGLLESQALRTTGTPDIAVGSVDVQVAQSGIALAIQMAPELAKNTEKEQELKSKTEQLLYDMVNKWFVVYEGLDPKGVTLSLTFGDPLPTDRTAVMAEIVAMVVNKMISVAFAQKLLRDRLGYDIPATMVADIAAEQATLLDAAGARLGAEDTGAPASTPAGF